MDLEKINYKIAEFMGDTKYIIDRGCACCWCPECGCYNDECFCYRYESMDNLIHVLEKLKVDEIHFRFFKNKWQCIITNHKNVSLEIGYGETMEEACAVATANAIQALEE